MGSLLFHLSVLNREHVMVCSPGAPQAKLSPKQKSELWPPLLCCAFLYGKAPWEPCVPFRGSLLLKPMYSLVLRESLPWTMHSLMPKWSGCPQRDWWQQVWTGLCKHHSIQAPASRLSVPANMLVSQKTHREMNLHAQNIRSLKEHLEKHYNFH